MHTHTHACTHAHTHTHTHMYKRAQSTHNKLPVHSAKGFANFSASLAMLPPTCLFCPCAPQMTQKFVTRPSIIPPASSANKTCTRNIQSTRVQQMNGKRPAKLYCIIYRWNAWTCLTGTQASAHDQPFASEGIIPGGLWHCVLVPGVLLLL